MTGADDDVAVREPAAALSEKLGAELVTVDGMAHEFAPGTAAAAARRRGVQRVVRPPATRLRSSSGSQAWPGS